jgi:hypothetical protein
LYSNVVLSYGFLANFVWHCGKQKVDTMYYFDFVHTNRLNNVQNRKFWVSRSDFLW